MLMHGSLLEKRLGSFNQGSLLKKLFANPYEIVLSCETFLLLFDFYQAALKKHPKFGGKFEL